MDDKLPLIRLAVIDPESQICISCNRAAVGVIDGRYACHSHGGKSVAGPPEQEKLLEYLAWCVMEIDNLRATVSSRSTIDG